MICNAVHPQVEALAAAGVNIEPCHLNSHAEGRHCFHASDGQPEPVKPATIHVVKTQTSEQWATEAKRLAGGYIRKKSHPLLNSRPERFRLLAATSRHLGVPVGIVVRTYQEGPNDAA